MDPKRTIGLGARGRVLVAGTLLGGVGLSGCAWAPLGAPDAASIPRPDLSVRAAADGSGLSQATQGVSAITVEPGPTALIDGRMMAAPDEFLALGAAVWDGERTLQGIWVAHPAAETARRVRIVNLDTGHAVDGALFRRDGSAGDRSVMVSSDAAAALAMTPMQSAALEIVAIRRAPVETALTGTSDGEAASDTGAAPDDAGEAATGPGTVTEPGEQDTEAADGATAAPAPSETAPDEPAEAAWTEADDPAQDVAGATPDIAAEAEALAEAEPETVPAAEPDTLAEAELDALAEAAPDALPEAEAQAQAEPEAIAEAGALAGTELADRAPEPAAELAEEPAAPSMAQAATEAATELATAPEPVSGSGQTDPVPASPALSGDRPADRSDAVSLESAPLPAERPASERPASERRLSSLTAASRPELIVEDWPIEIDNREPQPRGAARTAAQQGDPLSGASRADPEPAADDDAAVASLTTEPVPSGLDLPFVQAGLFGVQSNADRLIASIREAGYEARGIPGTYGGRSLTRVVAGPFGTEAARDEALRRIRDLGPRDAIPVRR